MEDTIFALATAQGKAGVAIVRVSGPESRAVLAAFGGTCPAPRTSRLTTLRDDDGDTIDQALVLFFEENASFTGEDVVELHLHGSVAIIRSVLAFIGRTGLARLAEPGEFTRRALMNGRLDLTQVQGLGDLIEAETEGQRKHAMRVFGGEVAERVGRWRSDILRATALIEATIDFSDEEIPNGLMGEVEVLIRKTLEDLEREITASGTLSRLKSGFDVALIGAPNSGKSSLLNFLTRSDASIVTNVPGTTRDIIEVRCEINGLPVTVIDTAGLRETEDVIEVIGVARARTRANLADLRVFLYEEENMPLWPVEYRRDDIAIRTKSDITGDPNGISVVTGAGVNLMQYQIGQILRERLSDDGLVSRERDTVALNESATSLRASLNDIAREEAELVAAHLRLAVQALERIIGGVDVEDVLGEIFSSFCIGK